MADTAIFGAAGAIGRAVGAELERRGIAYRVVGRNREKLEAAFPKAAEAVAADLAEPEAAAAAARGAKTIIYAVGVPYTRFRLHPLLMRNTIEAAADAGVERILVVSSVYSYGEPQAPRISEDHPRAPEAIKGRMRKEQEDLALDAHQLGKLKALVVHLPDFYGPHADNSLANPVFRAALAGKRAIWLGPLEPPREFFFVPDAGPVIVGMARRDDLYGERWNLGGPGTITPRDFISAIYREAGRRPKWFSINRMMMRVAGYFDSMIRELPEMYYLQEMPVVLDDRKLRARFGEVRKTPYQEGIRKTLEWMRNPQ